MNEIKDPTIAAVEEELKKLDGKIVARKVTVHGDILIKRQGGQDVELPLEFPEMEPLPASFNARLMEVMEIAYSAISQISEMPRRMIPLTVKEFVGFGATKQEIQKLVKLGLLEERQIKVHQTKAGMKPLARAVVIPTPQGRAYMRSQFDPSYGRPKK